MALARFPVSGRATWEAGLSLLPIPNRFLGVALPARLEWRPIQDLQPGTLGALTVALRVGTRVLLAQPVGCAAKGSEPECAITSAGGVVGEAGIAFRSGGEAKAQLEVAFGALVGHIVPYAGHARPLAGTYAGASISIGVIF